MLLNVQRIIHNIIDKQLKHLFNMIFWSFAYDKDVFQKQLQNGSLSLSVPQ